MASASMSGVSAYGRFELVTRTVCRIEVEPQFTRSRKPPLEPFCTCARVDSNRLLAQFTVSLSQHHRLHPAFRNRLDARQCIFHPSSVPLHPDLAPRRHASRPG